MLHCRYESSRVTFYLSTMSASTVALTMAKYTKREIQAAVLNKQSRERMGLILSKGDYDMIHHDMMEDCIIICITTTLDLCTCLIGYHISAERAA